MNSCLLYTSFNLDVNSSHYENQYPSVLLKGLVASIDYSDYNYENITLDAVSYTHLDVYKRQANSLFFSSFL